jgi:hypothetical protein
MYNKSNIFKQSSSAKKKSFSTEKKTNIFLNPTKKINTSSTFKTSQKTPNIFTNYQKNNNTNKINKTNKKEFDINKEEFPEFPSLGNTYTTIHQKDYTKILFQQENTPENTQENTQENNQENTQENSKMKLLNKEDMNKKCKQIQEKTIFVSNKINIFSRSNNESFLDIEPIHSDIDSDDGMNEDNEDNDYNAYNEEYDEYEEYNEYL